MSLNFMAAVTILSDFEGQENKICHCFHFFSFYLPWSDGMPWSSFFECWVLRQLLHSLLSPSSRSSLVPFHVLLFEWCHLHVWGCWYFSQQSWFQLVLHPAWYFTWCTLYNLNKQGDNIQPWHTLFPILNQSIVSCLVLTVASWPAHRFLRRQVR